MATRTVGEIIQQLDQVLEADTGVQSTARHKLPTTFRQEVQLAHDRLVSAHEDVPFGEEDRRIASAQLQEDYRTGEKIAHTVFNRIKGLSLTESPLPHLIAFGFASGKLGEFDQERTLTLLGQILAASADNAREDNPDALEELVLPTAWVTDISALRQRLITNELLSNVGTRADLVRLRNGHVKTAEDMLSRVWHYLSYALPERDQDPLLNNYGYTPRQEPQEGANLLPGTSS